MSTSMTVDGNKIASWLIAHGQDCVVEMLDLPATEDARASWNICDPDMMELIQMYECPLFPVDEKRISIFDWDAVCSAVHSELGPDHKLSMTLNKFPKKGTLPIPKLFRRQIEDACKSIELYEPECSHLSSSACETNLKEGAPVQRDSGSSSFDALHSQTRPETLQSSHKHPHLTSPNSQHQPPPGLSSSLVWKNNRRHVHTSWRTALCKRTAEKLDFAEKADGGERTELEVFDATWTPTYLKKQAKKKANQIVDWNFEDGRLEWQSKPQRSLFMKRVKENLVRWGEEWIGEVRGAVCGQPFTNSPTKIRKNILQRYERAQKGESTGTALHDGELTAGVRVQLAASYLTIESTEAFNGEVHYTARHSGGDIIYFDNAPWAAGTGTVAHFPSSCLWASDTVIDNDEDWKKATDSSKVTLRRCIQNGMLDSATAFLGEKEEQQQNRPSAAVMAGMYPDLVSGSSLSASESQGHSAVTMTVLQSAKGKAIVDPRKANLKGVIGARNALQAATMEDHEDEAGDHAGGDSDDILPMVSADSAISLADAMKLVDEQGRFI